MRSISRAENSCYLENAKNPVCFKLKSVIAASSFRFSGLNNFSVHTISDSAYDEYFGFTDEEVRDLLRSYDLSDSYEEVKEL